MVIGQLSVVGGALSVVSDQVCVHSSSTYRRKKLRGAGWFLPEVVVGAGEEFFGEGREMDERGCRAWE